MSTIGVFDKHEDEHYGYIETLSVQANNVRIVPANTRRSDKSPDYVVMVGNAQIGAGWDRKSTHGKPYISLAMDDPSFAAPIYASLFYDDSNEGRYSLDWRRR